MSLIVNPSTCSHSRNIFLKPDPQRDHTIGWCVNCGSIWVPKYKAFVQAFENFEREDTGSRIGDLAGVEGMWVRPGIKMGISVDGSNKPTGLKRGG